MSNIALVALAAASALAVASVPVQAGPGDPLAAYRWKARVLVVVAPDASDPKLKMQREIFRNLRAGAAERDLKLVEGIGHTPQAAALRSRFDLDGRFHAVLVGKDGGDKLTADEPLGADQLFPLIDAMPMRQQEMRKF